MSAEQFEKGVKIEAAVEKLGEETEKLDQTVSEYGQVLESYREDEASTEDVEDAVNEVLESFQGLFQSQNWLGELTAQITGREVQDDYEKFTAYRGLVCAADQMTQEQANSVTGPQIPNGAGVLRNESEALVDTWEQMLEAYKDAVHFEDEAQQISMEEGREREGLDPYAFETPFQVMEDSYQRVQELNECVNIGYR